MRENDKMMDGFVYGPGPAGRCDEMRVGGGVVDFDAIGGIWRMWCYCRDRELHTIAPKPLGSGRISLATSPDGVAWTRYDGPLTKGAVFEPSDDPEAFDNLHVGLTDVTRGAGEWLMWYFGGDRQVRQTTSPLGAVAGLGLRIGLARSKDGIGWVRVRGDTPSGALLDYEDDQAYTAWPNVFHDGKRLVIQYTAPDRALDKYPTLTAVSQDGRSWQKTGPLKWSDGMKPWDCTGIITRQVLPNPLDTGARFLMIYTGTDERHARSIAAAHSDDGVSWTHLYDGPIFHVGVDGAWDSGGVAATRLVAANGRLHLYYYGFQSLGDNDQPRGIGLAVTDSLDLRNLIRIKTREASCI
jgi:hypothetical protein